MSNSKKPKNISEKNSKSSLNDSDSNKTIQASLDEDFTAKSKVSKNNNSKSIDISFDKSKSISDSLNDLKEFDDLKYGSESSKSNSVNDSSDSLDSNTEDSGFDPDGLVAEDNSEGMIDDMDSYSGGVATGEDEFVYSDGNLEEDNDKDLNLNFKDSGKVPSINLKPKTSKKSMPLFLTICGLVIGIVILIGGILFYGTGSDRVVDSVASGETAGLAVILILVGLMVIIITVLLTLSSKSKLGNVFDEIKGIDESEFKSSGEQDLNDFEESSSDSEYEDSDSQKGEIKSYSNVVNSLTDNSSVSENNNIEDSNNFNSLNENNDEVKDFKAFNSLNENNDEVKDSKVFNSLNENNDEVKDFKEEEIIESSIGENKKSVKDDDFNMESSSFNSTDFKNNIHDKISKINKEYSESLSDEEFENSDDNSIEVSFNEALSSIDDLIDNSLEEDSESKNKSKLGDDENSK